MPYDVTAKLLTGLEVDRDYEFRVAAYNAMGQGPFGQPVVVFVGEAGKMPQVIRAAVVTVTLSKLIDELTYY